MREAVTISLSKELKERLDKFADSEKVNRSDIVKEALKRYPYLQSFSLIGSSDAHYLEDITWARTEIHVAEPTLAEIKLALNGQEQRKVVTI